MTSLTASGRGLTGDPLTGVSTATMILPSLSASSRDSRIDFFRGIALIGIALNHTLPPPEVYRQFGQYEFGHFFSFVFADIFVFLSGMVCAMAYTRVLE